MELTFHLIAGAPGVTETTASVSGDILVVNGTAFDFEDVPEGGAAVLSGDHPFIGPVRREGGVLKAGIAWVYDMALAARDQPATPPVQTVASGAAADPVTRG